MTSLRSATAEDLGPLVDLTIGVPTLSCSRLP